MSLAKLMERGAAGIAADKARKRREQAAKARAKSKAARAAQRARDEANTPAPLLRWDGRGLKPSRPVVASGLTVAGMCSCGGRILRAKRHIGTCRGLAGCTCCPGSELCERCHQPAPRDADTPAPKLHDPLSPADVEGTSERRQAQRVRGGKLGGRPRRAGVEGAA